MIPYYLNHDLVQTADYVAIVSEDSVPVRVIHLDGKTRPNAIRTYQGHSVGRWEGKTLVVETTHFRGDNLGRAHIGRPIVLSDDARVVERFTRVSDTELNYRYTVEDANYWTEPWRGEFSFALSDQLRYEYACHEGNHHGLIAALRGGRVADRKAEESEIAGK